MMTQEMRNAMTHKVTFTRTEYDYYTIHVDGKEITNMTIDKKPNGKFGCYDLKELEYFGANDTTLKECKEFAMELFGFGF